LYLQFNLVVKSATADLVLINSVLVEAKFVFAVSKSFEVAERFHSIKIEIMSNNQQNYFYLSDLFSNFLQQLLILDLIDPNSLNNKENKIKLKPIIFQKNLFDVKFTFELS
jgi:hypothetical protein